MKKLKEQYMELADEDPAVALGVLLFLTGIMGVGLIVIFVFGGSHNDMWEVWVWRAIMFSVLILVELGIWKLVRATYRI